MKITMFRVFLGVSERDIVLKVTLGLNFIVRNSLCEIGMFDINEVSVNGIFVLSLRSKRYECIPSFDLRSYI